VGQFSYFGQSVGSCSKGTARAWDCSSVPRQESQKTFVLYRPQRVEQLQEQKTKSKKHVSDIDLLDPTVKAHRRLFGHAPQVLATDKGFYQNMDQIEKLEQEIETVSICKKGRRTKEQYQRESTEAFIDGQRFRAGCEGSISVLKRVFKLGLCFFKGFKNYAASVGCTVLCHNLVLLAKL
jgi:hypothetical protein